MGFRVAVLAALTAVLAGCARGPDTTPHFGASDQRTHEFGMAIPPAKLVLANPPPAQSPASTQPRFVIASRVRVDPALPGAKAWEPTIVVGSTGAPGPHDDEVVALWMEGVDAGNGHTPTRLRVARSIDGASGFTNSVFAAPPQSPGIPFDPMSAYDAATGTLYVGAMGRTYSPTDSVWVARKAAGAATFAPGIVTLTGSGIDKGWMAAGPMPTPATGTVLFLVYNRGLQRSLDGGLTFSAPMEIAPSGTVGFHPRVSSDGMLTVTWFDLSGQQWFRRSLDGGSTFQSPTTIGTFAANLNAQNAAAAGLFRIAPFVVHARDPRNGRLYAATSDITQVAGDEDDLDVLLRHSDDNGATWSQPTIVNGDGVPFGDQFNAWIEVDACGRVHLMYFDTREHVVPDSATNALLDVYYAVSEDEGQTFSEVRVSTTPIDAAQTNWGPTGPGSSQQFLGDYLSMAVTDDAAYLAYPATDAGALAMFVARIDFNADAIFVDGFE